MSMHRAGCKCCGDEAKTCYFRWTITYTCTSGSGSTGTWGSVTYDAAYCLTSAPAALNEWTYASTTDNGNGTLTCTYDYYKTDDAACTNAGDCGTAPAAPDAPTGYRGDCCIVCERCTPCCFSSAAKVRINSFRVKRVNTSTGEVQYDFTITSPVTFTIIIDFSTVAQEWVETLTMTYIWEDEEYTSDLEFTVRKACASDGIWSTRVQTIEGTGEPEIFYGQGIASPIVAADYTTLNCCRAELTKENWVDGGTTWTHILDMDVLENDDCCKADGSSTCTLVGEPDCDTGDCIEEGI